MAKFRNPQNGYTQSVSPAGAFFGCLFFGALYFAYKGVWRHVFISIFAALFTFMVSWLVYPFFAYSCVENCYLERGWQRVGNGRPSTGRKKTAGPSFDGIDL